MGLVVTARGDKSERLGRLVILGIILYVGLDVVAQVLPPHYSPLHQAESDLAVGPYGLIMQFNFLVRGGLSLALVLALRDLLPAGRSRIGVVLLGVWSGCSALLAFFNTDILDDPALVPHLHLTWHGELHLVLATAGFIAAALGRWRPPSRCAAAQRAPRFGFLRSCSLSCLCWHCWPCLASQVAVWAGLVNAFSCWRSSAGWGWSPRPSSLVANARM